MADGRKPNEQSVLNDAWNSAQPRRQRLRIGDPLQRSIQNPVPAIRDESVAVLGPPQDRGRGRAGVGVGLLDGATRRLQSERFDFDRQREAAEHRHPFRFIGNDDHARRCGRDDLLPQQRTAAALDEAEIGRDLVGAVHRQIKLGRLVQCRQRHADPLGVAPRRIGGRNAHDLEAGAHALARAVPRNAWPWSRCPGPVACPDGRIQSHERPRHVSARQDPLRRRPALRLT